MTNPKKTPAVAEDVYNSFSDDDIDLEDKRNTNNKTNVPKNSAVRSTVCSPVCLVCQSSPKRPFSPQGGPVGGAGGGFPRPAGSLVMLLLSVVH